MQNGQEPVTPIDESSVMRMLYFEVQIDRHGPDWCEKKFIGAMRRKAEEPRFKSVAMIGDRRGQSFQDARASCANRLATFCAMCRRCPMALVPLPK